MCPSEATLKLRLDRKLAYAQAEQTRIRAAASNYGQRLARANKCRVYFCDVCGTVFPETEGIERPSGWLACPDCGTEAN
jgi:rubrerythrin